MNKRLISAAPLSAVLALAGLAGAVAAVEPAEPEDESKPDKTTTGTVLMGETEDGRVVYLLDTGEGEPIELQYGPSWFGGEFSPLHALVGEEITVGGNLRDGMPNENASDTAKENAAKAPVIRILTLDEQKRVKGKPPWAGGPKDVGEAHPGFDGWSKGQANKPEKPGKPTKPEKPAKPAKPAKVPPGQAKQADGQTGAAKPEKPDKGNGGPRVPLDDE